MRRHGIDLKGGIKEGRRVSIRPIEEKKLEFSF